MNERMERKEETKLNSEICLTPVIGAPLNQFLRTHLEQAPVDAAIFAGHVAEVASVGGV
nr:hypothetical protein [Alicyclobacillus pomorum]